MQINRLWGALGLVFVALPVRGQSVAARVVSKADQDLITALVAVEDSRDTLVSSGDPRRRGLASANAYIRAFTVRGLGRLEHASIMSLIVPSLDDPSAEVRAVVADALAQASVHGSVPDARVQLVRRLQVEGEAAVRVVLEESIGRLAQGSADQLKATAAILAPSLVATSIERRGAIRGLFFLSRKPEARPAGAFPTEVADRLFGMLTSPGGALEADDRINVAAILVNTGALNDARLLALFASADPYVRDKAVGALQRASDTSTLHSILRRAWKDPAPIVRYRTVTFIGRHVRAPCADQCVDPPDLGCPRLLELAHDRDMTVALAAVDGLGGCRHGLEVPRFLDSIAETFRNGDVWHMQVHALVSLATLRRVPPALMPIYAQAENFFVRMYADSAARLVGDTVALYRLARDTQPNVRSSAINGLARLVGHSADSIYLRALTSDDNQLLMAASVALKGSATPGVIDSLARAADRLHALALHRETALDGFKAVNRALVDFGRTTDYAAPVPSTSTLTFAELAALEHTEATIEMADGAVIRIRFRPFDAPTNTARFIRLAKAHLFDGLTFHRVAPFFVVQGLGPNANEYSAPDGPFTRDELGVENRRGSVGLSTRGRDTGDGQIYVNTVDNTWLDHEYTVMGTITSGLAAFDRMQEGAVIRRVTVAQVR